MKVLVFSSVAVWSGRLHVLLAVAQQALDDGDEVVFLHCDGSLPACVANLPHSGAICRYCIARQRKGLALLAGKFAQRGLSDYLTAEEIRAIVGSTDAFGSAAELRALAHDGADVGYGALSCYATATREPAPALRRPAVHDTLQRLVNAGRLAHAAMRRALERERPDRVVLFNGRHAADRAVLRCCRAAGVACDVYEVTQKHDHVTFFRNAMIGDIARTARAIEEHWAAGGDDKVAVAEAFFARTRHGVFTNDLVFVDRQRDGALPKGWDAALHNVVVFASSEDEYAALDPEWDRRVYATQAEAIERICTGLRGEPRIRVWLRLHPNMRDLDRSYVRALDALQGRFANLGIVAADSEISSYAMLDRAAAVATFGSTLGIEAVYWGVPSILLANCSYRPLGATYDPRTHDEVLALLRADLAPKDRTPALKFAFFRMTHGFRLPHFDGDRRGGPRNGYTFRGDRIAVRSLARVGYKLAKWRWRRALRPDRV